VASVSGRSGPGVESGVLFWAAGLEQMRVVADELCDHAGAPQMRGQGAFPDLDRTPRLPQKIERAAQQIVASRYAGQRSGVMSGEAQAAPRQPIDVRGRELVASVGAQQVAVEAVEQHQHGAVPRSRSIVGCGVAVTSLAVAELFGAVDASMRRAISPNHSSSVVALLVAISSCRFVLRPTGRDDARGVAALQMCGIVNFAA